MSLINELQRLRDSQYIPRPEIILEKSPEGTVLANKSEEGIWDVLGSYYTGPMVITVHEQEIKAFANKLSRKLNESDELKVALILKELVRLHEHVHAFLHTASVEESESGTDWFRKLSPKVNEPMAEAVVYTIIQNLDEYIIRIFEKADLTTPDCYRKWTNIKELPEQWLCTENMRLFVMFARTKVRDSWDDFICGLRDRAKLYQLCKETKLFTCKEENLRKAIEMETLAKWAASITESVSGALEAKMAANSLGQFLKSEKRKLGVPKRIPRDISKI